MKRKHTHITLKSWQIQIKLNSLRCDRIAKSHSTISFLSLSKIYIYIYRLYPTKFCIYIVMLGAIAFFSISSKRAKIQFLLLASVSKIKQNKKTKLKRMKEELNVKCACTGKETKSEVNSNQMTIRSHTAILAHQFRIILLISGELHRRVPKALFDSFFYIYKKLGHSYLIIKFIRFCDNKDNIKNKLHLRHQSVLQNHSFHILFVVRNWIFACDIMCAVVFVAVSFLCSVHIMEHIFFSLNSILAGCWCNIEWQKLV